MHNNMITVNGAKMSKSLGNFITLNDLFAGSTTTLTQAYSPMVVRFFLLQAHYRSPVDVSDEALTAARKGYRKLMNGLKLVGEMVRGELVRGEMESGEMVRGEVARGEMVRGETVRGETVSGEAQNTHQLTNSPAHQLLALAAKPLEFLNDDLNTPRALAALFDLLKRFNTLAANPAALAEVGVEALQAAADTYRLVVQNILGLVEEPRSNGEQLLGLTLSFYTEAKTAKDYGKVDVIRAALKEQGIVIKDTKAGVDWAYSEE